MNNTTRTTKFIYQNEYHCKLPRMNIIVRRK
jgi:hypothetical protein